MGRGQPRTPLRALQPPGGFGGSDKGVWLGFEGLCGLGRAVVGVPGDCHLAGTPGAGGFGQGGVSCPGHPRVPKVAPTLSRQRHLLAAPPLSGQGGGGGFGGFLGGFGAPCVPGLTLGSARRS